MEKVRYRLLFWLIAVTALMFVLGYSGVIWDKSDWIFLFLLVGIIVLNAKLNRIFGLLSKKKK